MRIGNARARTVTAALAVLAPRAVRRFLWRRLLGYDIDPTATIGHTLIDVDAFRAGPRAHVASLSVIRGCERVELEADSNIGPLVWVNAVRKSNTRFFAGTDRETALVLRRASSITSLHFIDCCDRVELGEFSLVSGIQSQLLSHAFDFRAGRLVVSPIVVGPYSMIGTGSIVLPGTDIGAKSIVAAGSVLPSGTYASSTLYAGVPAAAKADLDPGAASFVRDEAKLW